VIVVHAKQQRQEIEDLFKRDGTYNSAEEEAEQPDETGAMVPGMRGEDSTEVGVANDAGGSQAEQIDEATIEADVEHAQRIMQQQYEERKAQGKLD
jgi:hypothetical protein